MKNFILVILSILVLSGCEKGSSVGASNVDSKYEISHLELVPEVEDFFYEMNEFIRIYLYEPEVDNIIFEYTDVDTGPLEAPARGYCVKSGFTPKIILYRADWIGPYSADSTMKKAAFYHLMGHCVFNKSHNDERTYDPMSGNPNGATSFMHSNFGYHLFPPSYGGGTTTLDPLKMQDLQKAFFNYTGPL